MKPEIKSDVSRPNYNVTFRVFVNAQTDVFMSVIILRNVQNFRRGVNKIPVLNTIRPSVYSRANAHYALGLIKYLLIAMEICLPLKLQFTSLCLRHNVGLLAYFHNCLSSGVNPI